MTKKSNTRKSHRAKFLVYVDESKFAPSVVRFACSKAQIKKRPVEMLFVMDPSEYNSLLLGGDMMKRDRRKEAEAFLHDLATQAHEWSGIRPALRICEGDAEKEIIKCIEEDHDINMLIISSNPSSGSGGHKLIATIAERLDETLHIPMMIVPAHLTDEQIEELN